MKRIACLALVAISALASAAQFTTQRFDVRLEVRRNRRIEVTETIDVTFDSPQHGLIRPVPYRVQLASGQTKEVKLQFEKAEVGQAGKWRPITTSTDITGDLCTFRIGDPQSELSGPVEFRLKYTVLGAWSELPVAPDGSRKTRVAWNALPNQWANTIESSKVTLTWPDAVAKNAVITAMIGPLGSSDGIQVSAGGAVTGRTDLLRSEFGHAQELTLQPAASLEPGQILTISLDVPSKVFASRSATAADENDEEENAAPPVVDPLGLFVPLLPLAVLVLATWKKRGTNLGPVLPTATPPENLEAAECGYVYDGHPEPRQILGTVIRMAQKGVLRISTGADKGRSFVIELQSNADLSSLTPFEQNLYRSLAAHGPIVRPEALRGSFYMDYRNLSEMLKWNLTKRGLKSASGGIRRTAALSYLLGLLLVCAISFPAFGLLTLAGAVVSAIGAFFTIRSVSDLDPKHAEMRQQVAGFRAYLFSRPVGDAATLPLFDQLLPYAVALGAGRQWSASFERAGLGVPPWYDAQDDYWLMQWTHSNDYFDQDWYAPMVYAPETAPVSNGWDPLASNLDDSPSFFDSGSSSYSSVQSDASIDNSSSSFDSTSNASDSGSSFDSGVSAGDASGGGGGDSW